MAERIRPDSGKTLFKNAIRAVRVGIAIPLAGIIVNACDSDPSPTTSPVAEPTPISTPFATSIPEPIPTSTPFRIESSPISTSKELIHTFNDVFERLEKDFPETAIPSIAEQPAYEFRQGNYRYTLRRTSPNSDKKFIPGDQILETVYYHGTGQDAPNDPIIEYVLDSEEIKAGYMWFGRGTNRESVRDEKTAVNNLDISSLQSRLRGDFETWSKK